MDEESQTSAGIQRSNGLGEQNGTPPPLHANRAAAVNPPNEPVEQGPHPPPYASLPAEDPPPDFRQQSLRDFSLPRSASHGAHRSVRGPPSSSHQSQLRKQAHASLPAAAQRIPSAAGLAARNLSSSSTNDARSQQGVRIAYDIPPAGFMARSLSAPPPVEPAPESLVDLHSGWATVEVNDGPAGGAPPCERSLHAAALLNGCLLIFGGYDGQSRINDFHLFSFAEKRWSPVLPSATSGPPPSARDRHTAVAYGNSFYVFAGFDGTSRVNDFFAFDFSSMTWREVPVTSGQPPSARHSHIAVVHNHSLFCGFGYDGSYKSDLHEFDFIRSQWSPVNAAGRRPRARYRATCVLFSPPSSSPLLILYGGHDGTRHMNDTHVFDIETRIWSALVTEGTPPTPRDSHVSLVHGSSMFVFGGSTGAAMNDLHELQFPASPTTPAKWRPIKTSGSFQPGHRFCHVGVVFQDSMYFFGGYSGSERLNDFIRFDFAVYDLSFEVPPSSIISDFRALVNDETLSDITFIVEGQPVYAHKLMLLRSSYFRALFLGAMRESTQSTIPIEQVSYPIFLAVLEYLYTDNIDIPLESAMELFQSADRFCIPRLKTMCEKCMLQSITVENAAYIFHAADSHSATALRRKALKFILSHFEDVSKTESFEEMGRGNMELVFEILRNR